MKFGDLDLNLLVALDVLLREKNVSLAGKRIHLKQSAMSGALNRLRKYFKDELLVNVGRGMALTPRAEALVEPVRAALLQIEATITRAPEHAFDPKKSRRTFRIVASDYVIDTFLSQALRHIEREAPHVAIQFSPPGDHPAEPLERGSADLLIIQESSASPDHPKKTLFEDEFAVVAWKDNHGIGSKITTQQFFAATHVLVHFSGMKSAPWEELIYQRFPQRYAAIIAPDYSSVPHFVVATRRIATMHRRHAEMYATQLPLKLLECPVKIPRIRQVMQYTAEKHNDPGTVWLKKFLADQAPKARSARKR